MITLLLLLMTSLPALATTLIWFEVDFPDCEVVEVHMHWHNIQLPAPDNAGVARGSLFLDQTSPPWYVARWCLEEPDCEPMPLDGTVLDSLELVLDNGDRAWFDLGAEFTMVVYNPYCTLASPIFLPQGSFNGCTQTGVEETRPRSIEAMAWPNPFNPATTIHWTQPRGGWTGLGVYDLLGNRVGGHEPRFLPAGPQDWVFQAEGLASGTYLLRVFGEWGQAQGKLLLMK
jgi:hypothetical protein